jgi:malate dehydrogenase (oxaloacetate-decarboxylating)
VLAALLNALKLTGKKLENISVVTLGAGAAGIAVIRLLQAVGLSDVVLCDRQGAIYKGRPGLNSEKAEMAEISNRQMKKGSLADVLRGADVFIGVSAPGMVTTEMVKSMSPNAILFPMSNPTPEIMPDQATAAGAAVVGTGRSDFANQINNVLAFPGIFRGTLDVRASDINDEMKIAAAYALASLVGENELRGDYIIPAAFDARVKDAVAQATAQAAIKSGVARV